jgi:hypothetical protein
MPSAGNRFLTRLQTVCHNQISSGPTQHFEERRFASQIANLRVNHSPARKVNPPADVTPIEAHGPRRQDAALDSNQVLQRDGARHSGEGFLFELGV